MRILLRSVVSVVFLAATLAGSAGALAVGAGGTADNTRGYVVVLESGSNPPAVVQKHRQKYAADISHIYTHALKGYAATLTDSAVAALRSDAEVSFVAEDAHLAATSQMPGSCPPACALPTGVDRIDGESSSTLSGNGSGAVDVDVAILDSGVDASQAELNFAGGVNCTGDDLGTTSDPGKIPHGTFVGGIIGAKDDSVGIVGVAPGARLWSVRVIEPKKGIGFLSWFICGVDWVTATRTDSNPANDIEVTNMSLGGPGADDANCGNTNGDPLHVAICASVARGVHYVVSAGNEAVDIASRRPASYNEVLTVTAISDFDGRPGGLGAEPKFAYPQWACGYGADDGPTSFSNFASLAEDQAHTVAAPGDCIYSTGVGTDYLAHLARAFPRPTSRASSPCVLPPDAAPASLRRGSSTRSSRMPLRTTSPIPVTASRAIRCVPSTGSTTAT